MSLKPSGKHHRAPHPLAACRGRQPLQPGLLLATLLLSCLSGNALGKASGITCENLSAWVAETTSLSVQGMPPDIRTKPLTLGFRDPLFTRYFQTTYAELTRGEKSRFEKVINSCPGIAQHRWHLAIPFRRQTGSRDYQIWSEAIALANRWEMTDGPSRQRAATASPLERQTGQQPWLVNYAGSPVFRTGSYEVFVYSQPGLAASPEMLDGCAPGSGTAYFSVVHQKDFQHRFDEPYITGVIEQAKLFDVGRTRCGSLSGILLFFYMRDTLFEPGGRVLPTTPLPLDRPREARQRNSHLLFASAYLNADGSGYRLSRHYAASEAISMHLDEYEEEVVTVEATLAFIERDHKPKPRITKIDQPASDRVGSIMTGLTHAECPASLIAGSGSSSDDTSRLLDQFDLLVTVPQNIDRDELLVQLTYLRQDNGICAAALPVHGDDTYARVVINIDRLRSERYDARTFHYGYTDTQIRNGELRTTILNTFKGPGDVVLVLRELYPILRGDFAAVVMDHPAFYQFFRGYVYATTEFCREKTVGKAHRTSLRRADTGTQVGRTLIYSEALTPFVGNAVWGVAAPLIGNMFATEAQITSDVRALIDVRGCGSAAFARIEDYILAQTWFLQQDRR